MMNDMIDIRCEEMISAADEAQMEHKRAEHERDEREHAEAWERIEAAHGSLHAHDYSEYDSMGWKD